MTPAPHSSPVPIDTEAARVFYQQRLALFAKNIALILFIVYCFGNAVHSLYGRPPSLRFVLGAPHNQLHLLTVAVLATIHQAAVRRQFSPGRLTMLDVAGTILASLALVMMVPAVAMSGFGRGNSLAILFAVFTLHVMRAVFVPSSARTTLLVAGVSAVAMTAVTAIAVYSITGEVGASAISFAFFTAMFSAVIVVVATLTTRVIYGLREEVREARTLGQYALEDQIGAGGMGAVYRAKHAMLRRPTAVKLLHPEQAGAQNLARFEREVRQTSRLTHPNTVAIFDYGRTPDGIFYYAMEYLDGLDLQSVVELDGPQDPSRVVHIISQVCGALAEAHSIGLVHRDIKPANGILCERGGIPDVEKVVDFGLVKQLEGGPAAAGSTAIGTIMGTPLYMSPEAILTPDEIDARSDLYAVGALAYWLLTGTTVFGGSTVIEVCSRHIHAEPDPPSQRLGRAIPAGLEEVVLACLAKDRAGRPQTANELRERLLACEVERWTDDRARAWWENTAERRALAERAREKARVSGTTATLAVDPADLARRA